MLDPTALGHAPSPEGMNMSVSPRNIPCFTADGTADRQSLFLLACAYGRGMICSASPPPGSEFLNLYLQLILIYVGINIILTISLNLINGYMGEFSVGHAGFMAIGAYIASLMTIHVFPSKLRPLLPAGDTGRRPWRGALSVFLLRYLLLKRGAIISPLSRWPSA